MSNATDIELIEIGIKEAKEFIDRKTAMDRLMTNRDFKRVFLKEYFEAEPVRLVMLKANPSMQDAECQAEILKQMDAIGTLKGFMNAIRAQGDMAVRALAEHEDALEEALREDVEGAD